MHWRDPDGWTHPWPAPRRAATAAPARPIVDDRDRDGAPPPLGERPDAGRPARV